MLPQEVVRFKTNDKDSSLYDTYYEEYKKQTLENYTLDKWYLDNNKELNIIVNMNIPAGREITIVIIKIN